MKWSRFLLVNGTFLLAMLVATFYWAATGYDYVHVKGGAEMYFVPFAVFMGYGAVIGNALLIKNVSFLSALAVPLLNCILAVMVSFVLLSIGLGGTPAQLIGTYGVAYAALTIVFLTTSTYRRGLIAP